jgi:predicted translin family RNA/ssDNA-binding protein
MATSWELYEVLEEIYPLLLEGTFYDDYDEATRKVGRINRLLAKARGETLPEAA